MEFFGKDFGKMAKEMDLRESEVFQLVFPSHQNQSSSACKVFLDSSKAATARWFEVLVLASRILLLLISATSKTNANVSCFLHGCCCLAVS